MIHRFILLSKASDLRQILWQCQQLAMDTGGYLCVDSLHALIAA